ncbi:hypothetical protein CEQ90_15790 [Lewinellaceae bacterium SD302]|nr:hypothetical protein CEQ90_15790 [Lewinellaceae bacterium SD302]
MNMVGLKKSMGWLIGSMLLQLIVTGYGCEHMPTMPDDPITTIDTTTNPIDTSGNGMDTTVTSNPCEPDIIYFERDILPILISNCTTSGCHNAQDAQDGVILNNYQNTVETADVRPFDLLGSDLYEVITEDDPDKVMPRPPNAPLTNSQINLISAWILQGAEDLSCDETAGQCDTEDVSYNEVVEPIIITNCRGCHSGGSPSGGIDLGDFAAVRAQALNGNLYGVIERLPGFVPMPLNADKLPQCQIDQIESWIENGALQN